MFAKRAGPASGIQLGRGIFLVNVRIKWLLWNVDMHVECALKGWNAFRPRRLAQSAGPASAIQLVCGIFPVNFSLSTQEVRKPILPLHATSRHLKWHEVACSRCDTPLEVACATWSGMKWHAHGATRHLKWHAPLEVASATWSGMKWHAHGATRHLKWHAPLEVAWSGMLTVGHYDYDYDGYDDDDNDCDYCYSYYYYYYYYY